MGCRASIASCRRRRRSSGFVTRMPRVNARSKWVRSYLPVCCRNSPTPPNSSHSPEHCTALWTSVLVPNLKGAARALESGADLMLVPLSASHAHSLANLRESPDDVVAEIAQIRAARDQAGRHASSKSASVRHSAARSRAGRSDGSAAPPAGCPRRGCRSRRPRRHRGLRRSAMVSALFEQASRIAGDRFGMRSFPRHARARHGQRVRRVAGRRTALRCHAGRHRRMSACARRERQRRDRRRRLSVREHGNFHGVDFDKLISLRRRVAGWLDGEALHGSLWRAGLPKTVDTARVPHIDLPQ